MGASGIERLSQLVFPETSGIIWLTDTPLAFDSPGSYEMNYLLDGILVKSLAQQENRSDEANSFFLGENFGRPFFVGHAVIAEKKDFQKAKSLLETASPFLSEGSQVYILNKSKNTANINVLKELASSRPGVNFEHLNI